MYLDYGITRKTVYKYLQFTWIICIIYCRMYIPCVVDRMRAQEGRMRRRGNRKERRKKNVKLKRKRKNPNQQKLLYVLYYYVLSATIFAY